MRRKRVRHPLKKQRIPLFSIVEVQWEDAETVVDDTTIEALESHLPCIRHSVGYLAKRTPKYVYLAATDDTRSGRPESGRSIGDVTIIPRTYVQSIRIIEKNHPHGV